MDLTYAVFLFIVVHVVDAAKPTELHGNLHKPIYLDHVTIPKYAVGPQYAVGVETTLTANRKNYYCRSSHCSHLTSPCSKIVPRLDWMARKSRENDYMRDPVSLVFIHHTVMDRCTTPSHCQQAVHKVQDLHMHAFKWADIGYSFVVGEDGNAYEARGYDRVGAHTLKWNNVSIGIGVMGNFSADLPNGPALEAVNNVIECGIELGKISPNYKLYGHCDARPMFESPGRRFYQLIKTWPNYGHKMLVMR